MNMMRRQLWLPFLGEKRKEQRMKYRTLKKRKHNKKGCWWKKFLFLFILAAVIVAGKWGIGVLGGKLKVERLGKAQIPEWIDSQIIDVDGVSRNGVHLEGIKDIVIHYVGNPGSTAQQNHDFYCSSSSQVSSHFVVGLKGEIIQCIPLNEMSAASNWRNGDTISVEVCHPDDTGKFNDKTYKSLIKLTTWLLENCNLSEEHIIRHYDVTGKECPRYFVQHEEAWEKFKEDVRSYREK